MAQVTIYLPEALARELKQRSRRAGKSVSSLLADLAAGATRTSGWPEGWLQLFGTLDRDFPAIDDPPPDDHDPPAA